MRITQHTTQMAAVAAILSAVYGSANPGGWELSLVAHHANHADCMATLAQYHAEDDSAASLQFRADCAAAIPDVPLTAGNGTGVTLTTFSVGLGDVCGGYTVEAYDMSTQVLTFYAVPTWNDPATDTKEA